MLSKTLLRLLAVQIWACSATVLARNQHQSQHVLLQSEDGTSHHDRDQFLNFSSSAPHLFAATYSLLQQWSNTIFPNGHTVAPVEIPPYTLFYHGRVDGDLPPSPEWLAFDLEMSYGIMGSTRDSWLLTYQTTRSVRALYFDGESAALMGLGQLDTQMLLVFGNASGPTSPPDGRRGGGLWQEYARATGLCDWLRDAGLGGRGWGFEGVVRMNAGFEMVWCDFTSPSLRLLTRVNVTAPQLPAEGGSDDGEGGGERERRDEDGVAETSYYSLPPLPTRTDRAVEPSQPPAPPNWRWDRGREPFLAAQGWGWFDSATWHYGSSTNGPGLGEARARILSCGVLSFYSPRFAGEAASRAEAERAELNLTAKGFWEGEGDDGNRSVALKQLARRRRYHHLGDVSPDEALAMRESAESALARLLVDGDSSSSSSNCTGFDWARTATEIVQRTALQLKMAASHVSSFPSRSANATVLRKWLFDLRSQTHLFLVGYLEYPAKISPATWAANTKLFNETYSRCRYRYTRLLVLDEGVASLNPEEEDLRWAVEETWGNICLTFLLVGFDVERVWLEEFGKPAGSSGGDAAAWPGRLLQGASRWSSLIAELIAWLGWESEFTGCKEVCAWDERCYIPMWPLMASPGFGPGRPPRNGTGRYPGHGRRPPFPGDGNGNGSYPGQPPDGGPPPGPGMPRGRGWMGDDADLWEPKCVKADYIMGR